MAQHATARKGKTAPSALVPAAGVALKRKREELGLSLFEMSLELRLPPQTLYAAETGRRGTRVISCQVSAGRETAMKVLAGLWCVVVLLAGCGDVAPDPLDVKAAQGCEASLHLLEDVAAGKPDQVNADEARLRPIAEDLLNGAAEAKAAGKPLPKWSALGAAFVQEMADGNGGDVSAFAKDQDAITPECSKIPDAAKRAGGFVKS